MSHQCVRCSTLYEDGSSELLNGCSCGSKFFFYIRKEYMQEAQKIVTNLSQEQKKEIESDVRDLIVEEKFDEEKPVILDLESIKILEPGKYELDIVKLFKKQPLIIRVEEGKYIIDLKSTFESKDKA
ncbi:hypothetical protein J4427_02345 [Candidatus Woesearchaeota archaeon]|nr:hypothetical protein [Candidatus Woesearchaeota archaeon]